MIVTGREGRALKKYFRAARPTTAPAQKTINSSDGGCSQVIFSPGTGFFRSISRSDSIKLIHAHGAALACDPRSALRVPRRRAFGVRARLARPARRARDRA